MRLDLGQWKCLQAGSRSIRAKKLSVKRRETKQNNDQRGILKEGEKQCTGRQVMWQKGPW
jgi:hypothetical protein